MFNSKTDLKPSIIGEIESQKQAIDSQQENLQILLDKQAKLSLSIAQHQQQIEIDRQQLESLEVQQARQQQEAMIASELQQIRPLADRVNALSDELIAALLQYEKRVDSLRGQTGFANKFEVDRAVLNFLFPQIKHQIGLDYFTLSQIAKPAKR